MKIKGNKIGRNDKCPCGSGLKYKKCHFAKGYTIRELPDQGVTSLLRELEEKKHAFRRNTLGSEAGYYIRHIETLYPKSGKRIRSIGDRIVERDPQETFHEFLVQVMIGILSKAWFEDQMKLPEEEQHQIIEMYKHHEAKKKENIEKSKQGVDGRYSWVPDGKSQWILNLAYDLYCLAHTNYLDDKVLDKLRQDSNEFQGARYELAVAAIFARADFEIEHYDERDSGNLGKKHPEFVAIDRSTGGKIAVEAKSKRRKGVLGFTGVEEESKEQLKGNVQNLLKDAMEKEVDGLPYMIFIDLNSPLTPDLEFEDKPWLEDIYAVTAKYTEEEGEPAKANWIVISNWSYHYFDSEEVRGSEVLYSVSLNPIHQLPEGVADRISICCNKYARIPDLDLLCNEIDKQFETDPANRELIDVIQAQFLKQP